MLPKNKESQRCRRYKQRRKKMKSTCRQVKKEDKEIPHSYIMPIVLRIEIALHKS